LLEEPLGSSSITTLLDQNIEDDTILIDGTPQMVLNPLRPDEHLIGVSLVAWLGTTAAQTICKALTELLASVSHRFVGDGHAALSQMQFNIAQTETKHVIQPNRVADYPGGKRITVMGGC
jgi:hypothetical protein